VSAAKPLNYVSQTVRPTAGAEPAAIPSWDADRSGAGLRTADAWSARRPDCQRPAPTGTTRPADVRRALLFSDGLGRLGYFTRL
jgi:hypothetical protein